MTLCLVVGGVGFFFDLLRINPTQVKVEIEQPLRAEIVTLEDDKNEAVQRADVLETALQNSYATIELAESHFASLNQRLLSFDADSSTASASNQEVRDISNELKALEMQIRNTKNASQVPSKLLPPRETTKNPTVAE